MKHKTLFRLFLKILGVWFTVTGVSQLLGTVAWMFFQRRGINWSTWESMLSYVPLIIQVAVGLYLFFDGRWVADKAIPSNRPYCHECGYDLTGASGDVCNECGTPFRASGTSAMSDPKTS